MGFFDLVSSALKPKPHADRKAKCPKCNADVSLGMERCPSCGTHIESMFRIECPKCKTANDLKAEKCSKCAYPLTEQRAPAGKEQYRCPMCGYVADYYMMSCPACGVKFI
jgi:DNA-directed RNA polymerase subunit RPC12/RpoP